MVYLPSSFLLTFLLHVAFPTLCFHSFLPILCFHSFFLSFFNTFPVYFLYFLYFSICLISNFLIFLLPCYFLHAFPPACLLFFFSSFLLYICLTTCHTCLSPFFAPYLLPFPSFCLLTLFLTFYFFT